MLGTARSGPAQEALDAAMATLRVRFTEAGAALLDVPYLFLGDTLLNLYGEDLRARAFLFPDAERDNELCLRPDFTVPVALAHAAGGWDRTAFYGYQGPVFRRQPQGMGRRVEYLQAGVERFGDTDTVSADVAVFRLLLAGLRALGVAAPVVTIGDLAIPFAVLDSLEMSDHRRAALRRHFWRPARFHALVERASAPATEPAAAVPADTETRLAAMAAAGEAVGLRTAEEVLGRLDALAAEAAEPPMATGDADLLNAVLEIRGPAPDVVAGLRALTGDAGVQAAIDRFETRLQAIAEGGIEPGAMAFDAAFGRNLEYYDGFVFEMRAPGGTAHPPLAGGGRYDAMTVRLGAAAPVPAVGGIIRPEAVLKVLA